MGFFSTNFRNSLFFSLKLFISLNFQSHQIYYAFKFYIFKYFFKRFERFFFPNVANQVTPLSSIIFPFWMNTAKIRVWNAFYISIRWNEMYWNVNIFVSRNSAVLLCYCDSVSIKLHNLWLMHAFFFLVFNSINKLKKRTTF